jgi:hypothetical protein
MNPIEAAAEIGELSETLYEGYDEAVDLADLIGMIDNLDTAGRALRSASTAAKALANRKIEAAGEQRVVLPNGVLAERTGSWRRTDIDRDALVKYVRKCALLDDIRMDVETGELRPTEVVALELHQRCFRAEPKWTELKALGVDDDEFCRREFVASVKITKAKVLR